MTKFREWIRKMLKLMGVVAILFCGAEAKAQDPATMRLIQNRQTQTIQQFGRELDALYYRTMQPMVYQPMYAPQYAPRNDYVNYGAPSLYYQPPQYEQPYYQPQPIVIYYYVPYGYGQ